MAEIITYTLSAFFFILLLMFMVWGIIMTYKYMFKNNTNNTETEQPAPEPAEEKFPYILNTPIMSVKEKSFYRAVKPIADELGLVVFAKIRLADLLTVPKDTANHHKWFNYVKSKHVDFVLVDTELNIKAVIEVDDSTHNRPDRKERDEFVDKAFRQLGLEVLHIYSWGTRYGGVDLKETIVKALNPSTSDIS